MVYSTQQQHDFCVAFLAVAGLGISLDGSYVFRMMEQLWSTTV